MENDIQATNTNKDNSNQSLNSKIKGFFGKIKLSRTGKIVGGFAGIAVLAGTLGVGAYLVQQNQSTKTFAGGTALSITTSATNVKVGDTFTAAVAVNTNGQSVSAADLRVRYETAYLDALDVKPFGDFLPVTLTAPVIDGQNTSSGRAWITVGALYDESGAHPKSGIGVLAQITFKAKAAGATTLNFGAATGVAAIGQNSDAAGTKTPLTINIAEAISSPTPSPTPTSGKITGITATASNTYPTTNVTNALDDNPGTEWNAGGPATQWIQLDLQKNYNLDKIDLAIDQSPAGRTVHEIYAGATTTSLTLVKTLDQVSSRGQVLTVAFGTPIPNVRYIKINTTVDPSWVAWYQIDVWGQASSVAPSNNSPIGYFDRGDCNGLFGWAGDKDVPTTSIDVHFYTDGNFVGATTANVVREKAVCDVLGSTQTSCTHGFLLPIPASLKDGKSHSIYAYGINAPGTGGSNSVLTSSPKTITCLP